jgi:Flp pilus assembly pilin Flp
LALLISATGVPVRELFRRIRTCEAGGGLVEYALLLAVVALGLVGALRLFRTSVGGLTNRAAVSVSTQTGGSYGVGGGGGETPSEGHAAHKPPTPDPDSSSAEEDGPDDAGGATAASFRLAIP